MHEICLATIPVVSSTSRTAFRAALHQSAGSCSAHAGPGDRNGAWLLVADATMTPASLTASARVPLVPMSMPRTGMALLLTLRTEGLTADALRGNTLRGKNFVLQREHARRGFIDVTNKGDRAFENRFQARSILDTRLGILVLDDQMRVRDVQLQQLAFRQLMIQPVHRAVLQVG